MYVISSNCNEMGTSAVTLLKYFSKPYLCYMWFMWCKSNLKLLYKVLVYIVNLIPILSIKTVKMTIKNQIAEFKTENAGISKNDPNALRQNFVTLDESDHSLSKNKKTDVLFFFKTLHLPKRLLILWLQFKKWMN